MLRAMGTHHPEDVVFARYAVALDDPGWVVIGGFEVNRLVGYAALQDFGPHLRTSDDHRTARLHEVRVNPAARRRGACRWLVDAATPKAGARVRYMEWQVDERRSAPFCERLGYHGVPCPQPEYPSFVIDFADPETPSSS